MLLIERYRPNKFIAQIVSLIMLEYVNYKVVIHLGYRLGSSVKIRQLKSMDKEKLRAVRLIYK
jgi:hypothetical protein